MASLPAVASSNISVVILSCECKIPFGRLVVISPPSFGKVKCFILKFVVVDLEGVTMLKVSVGHSLFEPVVTLLGRSMGERL